MLVNLGRDCCVNVFEIVGIFDLDESAGKYTENFLTGAQKEMTLVNLADDLPRCAVVTDNKYSSFVYLTRFSSKTVRERAQKAVMFFEKDGKTGESKKIHRRTEK